MSTLAAASITGVVGYALRNSVPSVLRMRAMASTTSTCGAPSALRLGDEDGNLPAGLGLVLLVRGKRRHRELPQPRALGRVGALAHAHRLKHRVVAQLDVRPGAQVVDPDRVA